MTFDDGIVGVYELTEISVPGKQPKPGLQLSERFFFGYDTLGINRYYTAKQASQDIAAVINISGWNPIQANKNIAIIANADGVIDPTCEQFRIVMVQPMTDEYGLRITKLSLERIGDKYDVIAGNCHECADCG